MNSEIKNCGDFGLKEGFQLRHILGLSGIYFDAVVEYLSQSFHFYSGWIWPYYSAPFYHDILLLENELGVKKIQILSKKKNVGEEFQNSPFNIKNLIEPSILVPEKCTILHPNLGDSILRLFFLSLAKHSGLSDWGSIDKI